VALYKKINKKIDFFFFLKKRVASWSGLVQPPPGQKKEKKNGKIGFAIGGGFGHPQGP
jgi:hypothetical protein